MGCLALYWTQASPDWTSWLPGHVMICRGTVASREQKPHRRAIEAESHRNVGRQSLHQLSVRVPPRVPPATRITRTSITTSPRPSHQGSRGHAPVCIREIADKQNLEMKKSLRQRGCIERSAFGKCAHQVRVEVLQCRDGGVGNSCLQRGKTGQEWYATPAQ